MAHIITSKDYSGTIRTLVHKNNRVAVVVGAEVLDHRGAPAQLTGGRAPHKPSSQGFVYTARGAEFYPSVFNCEWE